MAKTIGDLLDPAQGYLGHGPRKDPYRYIIINDQVEEVREIVVHEFTIVDSEDPELYAAVPLWKWQQSEAGRWIMSHAVETPSWWRVRDLRNFGFKYQIRAKLMGPRLTEWLLKEHR